MERRSTLEVRYYPERDVLVIDILPKRRAVLEGGTYHFFVRQDKQTGEVVGFEAWDFAYLIPHLREPGVIPDLDQRFDVPDANLYDVTLPEVLEWAYQRFVLERRAGMTAHLYAMPQPAVTSAGVAEQKEDYQT
ncbi:MAG: hypothetical protein ACE5I2_07605 [Anaerolineae bacterium]